MNFVDFFLNPDNLQYFTNIDKNKILTQLKYSHIIPSRTICAEAEKIYDLLNNPIKDTTKQKMIYVPNYYKPRIRKCVYPDLTFGILNEEKETGTRILEFPRLESNSQRFLILTNTGISGMSINEPIIYVRVPNQQVEMQTVEQINSKLKELNKELNEFQNNKKTLEEYNKELNKLNKLNKLINNGQTNFQNKDNGRVLLRNNGQTNFQNKDNERVLLRNIQNIIEKLEEEKKILQSQFYFNYCIHTDPENRRNLKVIKYNLQGRKNKLDISDFTEKLFKFDDNINIVCSILLGIPENFGRFQRIREVSESILAYHKIKRELPLELSLIERIF
jgi:hypothetical protein